ncbi:MAG: hypothetical protein ABJB47_01565 [Actinomycetota bacterium]
MRPATIFCAARAALGTAYLLFPALAARLAGPRQSARAARGTARILGARHLTQALTTSGQPDRAVLTLGAEADATHAASMAALAIMSRRWRRAALTDALIATTLTAAGLAVARAANTEPAPSGWQGRRNQYAARLAPHLLPPKAAR